MLKMVEF